MNHVFLSAVEWRVSLPGFSGLAVAHSLANEGLMDHDDARPSQKYWDFIVGRVSRHLWHYTTKPLDTHTHARTHTHLHTLKHTNTHTHTHTHLHTHTHTRTHTAS